MNIYYIIASDSLAESEANLKLLLKHFDDLDIAVNLTKLKFHKAS